ncbi:MAG: hypothetical protein KAV82_02050 [Phycisphaerae bacterium]|nr:hypothetical protein [Phycisphaerae bacterium]
MTATNKRRGTTTTGTTKTGTGTWNSARSASARKTTKPVTSSRTNYTTLKNNFQQKITSYRTLYGQVQGASGAGRPSAATLNTFANWVNKGAVVYKISTAQINRWSETNKKCTTATTARNVLCNKFGKMPIKAVCKTKSGSYLVATASTYRGKTFKFPR